MLVILFKIFAQFHKKYICIYVRNYAFVILSFAAVGYHVKTELLKMCKIWILII